MSHNPTPFQRSQSAEYPNTGQQTPQQAPSFQRSARQQIRDSLTNVIREIEPFVETARSVNAGVQNAISITQLLNRSQSEAAISRPQPVPTAPPLRPPPPENNSFVINVDANVQIPEQPPNNNNSTEDTPENDQTMQQTQLFLQDLFKYIPFILILLAKAVYDYHEGIFIVIILFFTFNHSNNVVKKEATKREKRELITLTIELLYIVVCLMFIHYFFEDDLHNFNVVLNLILIRTFTHPLTVWNLLWIVMITDFILKLITVCVKILLTMLPEFILKFKKRGKVYLFIEAISQLYRSIATVQPWLYYLLECYQGPEKIVAVFLSAFYMISKGTDLMSKVKLVKVAFFKLLQNVVGIFLSS